MKMLDRPDAGRGSTRLSGALIYTRAFPHSLFEPALAVVAYVPRSEAPSKCSAIRLLCVRVVEPRLGMESQPELVSSPHSVPSSTLGAQGRAPTDPDLGSLSKGKFRWKSLPTFPRVSLNICYE